MIHANAILIVAGIACLFVGGFAVRRLIPREGRPVSAWVNSDALAATAVVGLLSLFLVGAGLVLKGILA